MYLYRIAVDTYLAGINQAIKRIHMEPVTMYNFPAGIKLFPSPGSIFAQMGLRSSDVIVGVNGESITRPKRAVRLLEKVKEGGDVSIQIKGQRRNRIIQLDVG